MQRGGLLFFQSVSFNLSLLQSLSFSPFSAFPLLLPVSLPSLSNSYRLLRTSLSREDSGIKIAHYLENEGRINGWDRNGFSDVPIGTGFSDLFTGMV
ncbi:hypothetical protein FCM35_KLT05046 [Carex littledalei]|uniref:Uncharacterized protein n=1 Tax=Carex littledalei TaxID=544730 RepID=A0A833VK89_9POAL|nr:hypothetical protein FCM35_KLT05046 [Carex littledalei]